MSKNQEKSKVEFVSYRIIDFRFKLREKFREKQIELTYPLEFYGDVDYNIIPGGDENTFIVGLKVEMKEMESDEFPFSVSIEIEGMVRVENESKSTDYVYQLNVDIPSQIYNIARALIGQVTAQTNYPSFFLPDQDFFEIAMNKAEQEREETENKSKVNQSKKLSENKKSKSKRVSKEK